MEMKGEYMSGKFWARQWRASLVAAGVAAALLVISGAWAVHAQSAATPAAPVQPQPPATVPTEIRVHVLARGGKYLGDDIGGARVTIRDALSGEVLASGVTRGGSGPADLMTVKQARTTPLPTDGASVFTTTLDLAEPRLLEFEAYGPLAAQGSAQRVTSTEWVLPQPFTADGNRVTLELAGLNVDIRDPQTHFLPKTKPPLPIPLRVNVTMMCGCPIGPGLAWEPDAFRVMLLVKRPDGQQELVELAFDADAPDGAPSQFIGSYTATLPGIYAGIVLAHEADFGNSGSDRVTWIVP